MTENTEIAFDTEAILEVGLEAEGKISLPLKIVCVAAVTLVVMSIVMFLAVGGSIQGKGVIADGVTICGEEYAGLSVQEATTALSGKYAEALTGKSVEVTFGTSKITVNAEEYGFQYDIAAMANQAYSVGHSGGYFKNCSAIFAARFFGENVEARLLFDRDKLRDALVELALKQEEYNVIYSIDEANSTVRISIGNITGVADVEEGINRIADSFAGRFESVVMPEGTSERAEDKANILYAMLVCEPKNATARVENGEFEIIPEVSGVSVDKNVLIQAIKSGEQEVTVPIILTEPEITQEMLGARLFRDALAEYTTHFNTGVVGRTQNLRKATNNINGYVLAPGEEFSFNNIVGERTVANGFAVAIVYENGKMVEGLGGGICQVSSTLYTAALYANLEISARTNHTFTVSYLPNGQDATVAWGSIDFRFKNNKEYPIKIVAETSGGTLSIKIIGTQVDPTLSIAVENVTIENRPYRTVTKPNPDLSATRNVVTQSGVSGVVVDTYKIYKRNGVEEKREFLHRSEYHTLDQIILTPVGQAPAVDEPIVAPQDPIEPAD